MKRIFDSIIFTCLCLLATTKLIAQEVTTLTLTEAVDTALHNYPALRESTAREAAATANAELARISYQPKVDFLWQQNLASHNNVFGLLLPQPTIPAISGPALGTGNFASVLGSATGVLITWEPFDFGLRKANIEAARASAKQTQAQTLVTKLEVATTAADAYLACIAALQSQRAIYANVERLEIFSQAVHVLVDNQLRPGLDASRTDAELAAARNLAIKATEFADLARATLAEAIGQAGTNIAIKPEGLADFPPEKTSALENNFAQNPFALAQQSVLDAIRARQNILGHSYVPKLTWQSALFARGSGIFVDGASKYSRGFYPDTANWATGLTLSFSPTDIFALRKKKQIESANYIAEQAKYEQTLQRLKANEAKAQIMLDAARKYAANAPLQLKAAQETEIRVRARYQAELATITEVADAQRLLTQAEVENALARLSVWRALLTQAKANGDLQPFLALLKK